MSKSTAHWVLFVFDLAAILACYYVVREWQSINTLLNNHAESVTVQQYFVYMGLMLIVPVTHLLVLFDKKPLVRTWGNRVLVVLLILSVSAAFYFDHRLGEIIEAHGYSDCATLSEPMTFSEMKFFVRSTSECPE